MHISLTYSAQELKDFLQYLDQYLLNRALEWALRYYKAILEGIDEAIAENRSKDLKIEHHREVWYQTCLGPVKIKRRQYKDGKNQRRCLLDEVMGMERYNHTTLKVQELALELVSLMPYRRSAEVLRKASAIDLSHQTLWRMVGKVADPYLEKEEEELKWFLETGEIAEGEGRKVSRLLLEADGVILSLQREKEQKAEVKLGIAYEGWERVGRDRYKTVNKTAFATVGSKEDFWPALMVKLQKTYDLSRIRDSVVGGDGAGWIKEGASYVNGCFQLDRYHLHKELCLALGREKQTKEKVWEACELGEVAVGLELISEAMKKAQGEQLLRLRRAYRYIQENGCGLGDYRLKLGEEGKALRRTGAIEGNIDKLIVRRMKNQGMSWSLKGISRLLCVRLLILEKKLSQLIQKGKPHHTLRELTLSRKQRRRIVSRLSSQEPEEWIKANLPALEGPHAFRPWARRLKSLVEGVAL
ncbi:MAG: ISLre2 family transposase [Dehalococcoidales bacterium]|nr:ISLre2 family transposase [Dehalococcoidales bacterium]